MINEMNLFETLPNEIIVAQCEQMDAVTLARLSKAYVRVWYVCKDILEKKKSDHLSNQRAKIIMDNIKGPVKYVKYVFNIPKGVGEKLVTTERIARSFISSSSTLSIGYNNGWRLEFYDNSISSTVIYIENDENMFDILKQLLKYGATVK